MIPRSREADPAPGGHAVELPPDGHAPRPGPGSDGPEHRPLSPAGPPAPARNGTERRATPPTPLRLLVALLRALGPVRASNLLGGAARTLGPLLPVSRVADANLRRALPSLDRAARRRIIRGVWDNLGRTIGEFPHIGALPADAPAGPALEVEGVPILRALAASPGPCIFVSAHLGNWEALPAAATRHGVRFGLLYRAAAAETVDALTVRLRRDAAGTPLPVFRKGAAGARASLAFLREGGALGLLVDQKMNDGVEARFFGQPAMTAPALAALALRFRCPVVPAHCRRLGPARLRVTVEPPLPLPDTGNRAADVLALTQAVNDRIEGWVREYPEGWLWLHRRWPKRLPEPSP